MFSMFSTFIIIGPRPNNPRPLTQLPLYIKCDIGLEGCLASVSAIRLQISRSIEFDTENKDLLQM